VLYHSHCEAGRLAWKSLYLHLDFKSKPYQKQKKCLTRNGIFTLKKILSNYKNTLIRPVVRFGTFGHIRRRKTGAEAVAMGWYHKGNIFLIFQWMGKDDSEPISA
jgi:hypothetical protein